jgi:hypothetical protein
MYAQSEASLDGFFRIPDSQRCLRRPTGAGGGSSGSTSVTGESDDDDVIDYGLK